VLRDTANVRLACAAAEIDRSTAYRLRESDEIFAAAWEEAIGEAADLLEAEARRRAIEGLRRVKFDRGRPIMVPVVGDDGLVVKDVDGNPKLVPYVEHEYSDTLLIFLLKAALPGKYRETTRNINVNLTPEQAAEMSDEELDAELKRRGLA